MGGLSNKGARDKRPKGKNMKKSNKTRKVRNIELGPITHDEHGNMKLTYIAEIEVERLPEGAERAGEDEDEEAPDFIFVKQ